MAKASNGRWVVYERRDGEFIYLSKPLKTKEQAEAQRQKLLALGGSRCSPIGIGFVKTY